MKSISLTVVLVAMCALLHSTEMYPVEEEYDDEQTVPILKPGPYESSESSEDQANEFDLPVNEASAQKDSEELENDSGFHHDQGDNRPDGARRHRRSPQESYEYDDDTYEETGDDENDNYYETDDEGGYDDDDDEYNLPNYNSEEGQYENEAEAIDDGEFDDELDIAQDEDGPLLRMIHDAV